LFKKHLELIGDNQKELRRRLQKRILHAMERITFLHQHSRKTPEPIIENYLSTGLSLLNMKDRLVYNWYTGIRLPLRNLLKKGDLP